MTESEMLLSEYIEVRGRFRRSTHLAKDFLSANQNGDYILTPAAREALRRLAEGMGNGSPFRAWTLTGPYGVGKSAFAVFLTRLFCSSGKKGKQARHQLEDSDPFLGNKLRELGLFDSGLKGYLPVLATARRTSASKCMAEGILTAASMLHNGQTNSLMKRLQEILASKEDGQSLDTRQIVNALHLLSERAVSAGHAGVLVTVDELGKLFEYAARYPQKSDVFVLQEVAEQAARSNSNPIFFVGLLHQSFQEYGHHLDLATRREWAKIQGRFEDIAFLEPAEQIIRMIAQAIRWTSDFNTKTFSKYLCSVVDAALKAGVAPPGIQNSDFEATAKAAYPLHPVTLVALPFIFRRFAQNERSLFSYLSSLEPYGFQEFIRTHTFTFQKPPVVRLGHLFDYFTKSFGAGLYRHPHALRWLEAADVLERKETLSPLHREIVKTIGVLNALGEFCHLNATEEIISITVADSAEPTTKVRDALKSLKNASIITYRKFNDTYRIWEGSDVDIEDRIAEGARNMRQGINIADSVKRFLPNRPLVARRHSFETGALRYFTVEYIDEPEALSYHLEPSDADGTILVCLAESPLVAEHFRDCAMAESHRRDVLFAIPQLIGDLRAAVTELGALRWAWENTPGLRDDRVARREISMRITEADQLLQRNVNSLLDPRDEPAGSGCLWVHAGDLAPVQSPVDVSHLLSTVCDEIYSKSPKIRNELIMRRSISSAAAAARRKLVERMLGQHDKEALGIQGYPPERSIYESVLKATGLHRKDEYDRWGFHSPDSRSSTEIVSAWNCLCNMVFEQQPEPIALDKLYARLSAPPFGVLAGLHPIILCALMLAHPDETTLYREGTFIPEPGIVDFEVFMRRPELYALAGSRITGERAMVVTRLAKGLNVSPTTVPVVRALFRMVKTLPKFAWNTRRLPDAAIELREAFQFAKSPEQFLFVILPEAMGLPSFLDGNTNPVQVERFFNLLNENLRHLKEAMPSAINSARDKLLRACGLNSGNAGWTELRRMAVTLEPAITDPHLLPFLQRVTQTEGDDPGVESVLALIANRPPHNWNDADIDRFPDAASAIGRIFQEVALSIGPKSSVDIHLAQLTPSEQRQAKDILRNVRDYLYRTAKNKSPRAIKAAMMGILEELKND